MPATYSTSYTQGTNAQRLLAPAAKLRLGTVWYETDTGNFYDVVLLAGIHQYALIGGSAAPSAFAGLLYVVDDNPALAPFPAPAVGVKGPFNSIANALAQIAFDAPLSRATILVMRGQYTENVVLPAGVSLIGATQQGHNATSCVVNGTVTASAGPETTVLAGLRIAGVAEALIFGGATDIALEVSNCELSRSTPGAVVTATNTGLASVLSFHGSQIEALSTTDTAINGTAFAGALDLQDSNTTGVVIGPIGTFNARGFTATGQVRGFGAGTFERCSFTSDQPGTSPFETNGSTFVFRTCVATVAALADAAISATAPSFVELSDLEIRGGGRVFSGAVTHTPIQGSRSHVISTSAAAVIPVDYRFDLIVSTSAVPATATLPALTEYAQGKLLVVKSAGAGTVTLSASGGNLFDTAPTLPIAAGFTAILMGDRDLGEWRVIGYSSTVTAASSFPKYIVAEAGSPQEVLGLTYPTPTAAMAAATVDFGGARRADILVMPGSYGPFTLLSGCFVQALSPFRPSTNTSVASLITGTITIDPVTFAVAGAQGGLAGLTVSSASDAVSFPNGSSDFDIAIENCSLISTGPGVSPIAFLYPVVPGTPGTLTIRNSTLTTGDTQAVRGGILVGANLVLENCTVNGGIRSDVSIVMTDTNVSCSGSTVQTAGTGGSLTRSSIRGASPLTAVLQVAVAATISLLGCVVSNTSLAQNSISGLGTINALDGSIGGVTSIASSVTILNSTGGRGLAAPPLSVPEMTADGYFAPAGNALLTLSEATDTLLLDCTATAAASVVTITLPDAKATMQFKEIIVKRIDNNAAITVTMVRQGANEIDRVSPALTSLTVGPTDSFRLLASREPSGGVGRWLRIP